VYNSLTGVAPVTTFLYLVLILNQQEQPMANDADSRDSKVVAFRAPAAQASALEKAAAHDLCSASDIARGALLKDLRARGL
jgi:hypothetical protein